MMTRQEHLDWCKGRALEYVNAGDLSGGMASMMSDMSKHDETALAAVYMTPLAVFELMNPTEHGTRKFIEGFN